MKNADSRKPSALLNLAGCDNNSRSLAALPSADAEFFKENASSRIGLVLEYIASVATCREMLRVIRESAVRP